LTDTNFEYENIILIALLFINRVAKDKIVKNQLIDKEAMIFYDLSILK
jgi:hypothetical protein